jgi:cob(I)alamin adenosyltransferase
MIAGEGETVHGDDAVASEPGNLPGTVCDLPAENRKRANRLSTLSPLQFNRNFRTSRLPLISLQGGRPMSIATKRGDRGQTGLAGGIRVSKSSVRVEAYGTVDELNAAMGLARALCQDEDLRTRTAAIQKELFRVGSALATPAESAKGQAPVPPDLVDALTEQVHQIESIEGVLSDWSISGEHAAAAAYDVARTVCRRAERNVVRLAESGEEVNPNVLAYLNRLSDLLWLFGRKLEFDAGVNGSLRAANGKAGPRWSRAW